MVSRAGASSIKQLLNLTARRTNDADTKIKILAVKAANYDIKMNQTEAYQTKDSQMKTNKMERLRDALMKYKSMNKQQAHDYANVLMQEAKLAMQEQSSEQPFESSLSRVTQFNATKDHARASAAFFGLINESRDVEKALVVLQESKWSKVPSFTNELATEASRIAQAAPTPEINTAFSFLASELTAFAGAHARAEAANLSAQEAHDTVNYITTTRNVTTELNKLQQSQNKELAHQIIHEARKQAAAAMRHGNVDRAELLYDFAGEVTNNMKFW